MLLAIAVNSQYSNMKDRLLRQQIEIWIATCSEQTANQNTNIAWQYCKVARKRTTGFTVIKSVRELKRFPHLDGGFTSQYAPVGWEFAKICDDVKPNPHLGPGWGGVGVSIDKCITGGLITATIAVHVGKTLIHSSDFTEWQKERIFQGLLRSIDSLSWWSR